MIVKASNIDGLNNLFHFIYIPICIFEDQVKIAKFMSHKIEMKHDAQKLLFKMPEHYRKH